nr:MAG TPA: hypothetical protein [Caudoviricetes sp.]
MHMIHIFAKLLYHIHSVFAIPNFKRSVLK